jgi:hypothetical protein
LEDVVGVSLVDGVVDDLLEELQQLIIPNPNLILQFREITPSTPRPQ